MGGFGDARSSREAGCSPTSTCYFGWGTATFCDCEQLVGGLTQADLLRDAFTTDDEQRALCKATAAGNTVALAYLMGLHLVDVASDEQRRAIAQAIRRRWGNTEATYFINGEGFPRELHPGSFVTPDGTSICEQAEKQREQRSKQRSTSSASKAEKQREQAVHHHEQGGCVII